jgi:hypothetical protein
MRVEKTKTNQGSSNTPSGRKTGDTCLELSDNTSYQRSVRREIQQ